MGFNEDVLKGIKSGTLIQTGIKESKVFNASRYVTALAAGANADSIFITGALPVVFFERTIGRSGSGISATIYRTPTYTGGTPAIVYNCNDLNDKDSTIQLLAAPTVTVVGTQTGATAFAIGNTSNQGRGDSANLGQPLFMLPNTTYLLRITSLDAAAQNFSSNISWYEGSV
ncbi:MAG: hypothetical protein ACRCVU_13990 [Flavobacterium sp.]